MADQPKGKIITFYSYKGGVGRSMALANIGVLLAQLNKKVLLVDWDLEAPGLEHYFVGLTKSKANLVEGGLLTLLGHAPTFRPEYCEAAVTRYCVEYDAQISLLASGVESARYSATLADFAWSDYFKNKSGGPFLEELRNYWLESYDFILIDSRTGVTDSGGICTILMPDVLLLFFAANRQNLNGILRIARAAKEGRSKLYVSRCALPILAIPARFDGRGGGDISRTWLERIAEECEELYSDWIAPDVECRALIEQIKIPYIPRYSFDEGLPVLAEGTSDPDQIGYFYRNIATLLNGDVGFDGDSLHARADERLVAVDEERPYRFQARTVRQVMVSSTFSDLTAHRAAIISAIHKHSMHANTMEYAEAEPAADVIESSLRMVRESAGYVCLISLKYGQTPECPVRNPDRLSLTELEFNEALARERPILVFIMGDDHPVRKHDIEGDPEKEKKLDAFRERAKKAAPGSSVQRVYAVFNSLEEFRDRIGSALSELARFLDSAPGDADRQTSEADEQKSIPNPPAFYAEPDYIGSHRFVGRESELQQVSDWAKPADPTSLLLFEAIGGNGKSMLTWEWVTIHASKVRTGNEQWAGRFWYSFHESEASMADFCRRALAYMTGRPLREFAKKKTAALAQDLLAELHARPWLLTLDGLERVLVAYHRIDAAQVPDEDTNAPIDQIADRNPFDAIRDEDNGLIRSLALARPSKILVSSRLTPRALLNPAGQTIVGARRILLQGLRPNDAEMLLRSCGIHGDSDAIQSYLTENCDNHPLVIGALGGLINNYLPDRGNFDAWAADLDAGAKLDLGSLDLIQGRNHILRAALDDLAPASRQLLSTLALLSDSVDYETLKAFNPHLPPEPEEVDRPSPPEQDWRWNKLTDEEKAELQEESELALKHWNDYESAVQARLASAEYREAPKKLTATVNDLEQRGLLQYDGRVRRYDIHPVVRAVAAGWMQDADKERYGQHVVDYFSSLPHNPYEQAETLEDLRAGLNVVRTLLKLGHFQEAADAYRGDLSNALFFNLEAYAEALSLLRPFFPEGWGQLPKGVDASDASDLANWAAIALDSCGEFEQALSAYSATLLSELHRKHWSAATVRLRNITGNLGDQNLLAKAFRVSVLALDLGAVGDNQEDRFTGRLILFGIQSRIGQLSEADAIWRLLDPMGRDWARNVYRPGTAEWAFALRQYRSRTLREEHLVAAERLAAAGKNRTMIRDLHRLRGVWRLERGEWVLAAASLAEALRMAREIGALDADSETALALAKCHLGDLLEPRLEAERLAQLRNPAGRLLAELWLVLGDDKQAKIHALTAYKWAWADGEPYVNRYELTRTTELLTKMGVPVPDLPPYDPAKDKKFPWEDDVRAAIEKLRAEKAAERQSKGSTDGSK
jgi:cellulose biosynthesis protein BcsQ